MAFNVLSITDSTLQSAILQQIDNNLTRIGTSNPTGVVAAPQAGVYYIDDVHGIVYQSLAGDGTVGGTTWTVVYPQLPTTAGAGSVPCATTAGKYVAALISGSGGVTVTNGSGTIAITLTGKSLPAATADGQIPIGSASGGGYTAANLTPGAGISITNTPGGIQIAASGVGTVTSITAGTGLSGGTITTTGTIALANVAGVSGSYTNANITVDGQGRISAASNGTTSGTVTSITAGSGLSGGVITTTGTISLPATGVTAGSYTNANITVDTYGRLTSASSASGVGTVTSITAGSGLSGGTITTTGTISLPTTGVTAGSYTNTNITVDAYGRITAASTGSGGSGGITGLTGDVTTAQTTSGNVASFDYGSTHIISPSISSSQNNWSPTGWLSSSLPQANVIRVTASAYVDITGLVPPTYNVGTSGTPEGMTVTIQCAAASTFPIRLVANSSSSSAANRFAFPSNIMVAPGESVTIIYDNTAINWRECGDHKDIQNDYFGSGKDGNVTTSGTTTLTRDMYYQNLTVAASTSIITNGFKIFVSEMLDLSAASTGSIVCNGGAGGNGSGLVPGPAGAATVGTNPSLGASNAGHIGGAGSSTGGNAGQAATNPSGGVFNPQTLAAGGKGGNATNTGGSGGVAPSLASQASFIYKFTDFLGYGATLTSPSGGGAGGGGGAGSSSDGGAGGGGGASGGVIYISARYINRGSNTNATIISALGGLGGNGIVGFGGSNAGGGGGGGGGAGGTIFIYYNTLFGSSITNAVDVTGGNGGSGGNALGTGLAGGGGNAGPGGYILQQNIKNNTISETFGSAFVAASGQSGATATAAQQTL